MKETALILLLLLSMTAIVNWLYTQYKNDKLKDLLDSHILSSDTILNHNNLYADEDLLKAYTLYINNNEIINYLRIRPPYDRKTYSKVFKLIMGSNLSEEEKKQHIMFYLFYIFEV